MTDPHHKKTCSHQHEHGHELDLHGACCGGETDFDPGRRSALDLLAKGGMAAMLAGMTGALPQMAQAQDDDVLRIGYLPITDATPLLVAHAKGYFEEEGVKAEKPTLIRGWSPLIEGFAAGKFNLVHFLKPIPVWMRYNNNFPVKVMAWAHTNGSALVVGRHTDIADFAGLGGKQVAVPFWYSMHNIVLQYALRAAGIKPVIKAQGEAIAPDECNLQVLPPPEMPPALAAKKIDAYIVAEPFNALGELKAGARMLRFTGDIWKNHPCCVVCMNEETTKAKPEWTQGVMNAVVKASIYASQNKEEVAELLSKDGAGYLPAPAAVVKRAMTLYADNPDYIESGAIKNEGEFLNGRIDFQPWPYPSATKLIVGAMNKTVVSGDTTFLDGLDPEFVANDLVDYNFVKNALEKYPEWKSDPSVSGGDPYTRTEILKL
ncbi:Bicarbonate transport ATP-binding protein CmpC [Thalassovita gelatinovora]|uniref:Bicarbonate transport ATP-binding protein CmpC n=1 Tax=Thalassovita gelatinovora TaxID=53501 RepID=A0A0P1F7F4_THAGE|nr:ABC transporter substrate-binding protein [Thalassovita gelatinovora]QIZ82272.1 ABC transporter substrate-binding protein [Thalassovita gelatinovora]CUH63821.1 Bicarbonate transport ATP-binding protein CmpC [Thalassovita gelatinovora]SEQ97206.1 NitT/TauT family transport system substrate-binding protein [Thalassovita gelatinovora]